MLPNLFAGLAGCAELAACVDSNRCKPFCLPRKTQAAKTSAAPLPVELQQVRLRGVRRRKFAGLEYGNRNVVARAFSALTRLLYQKAASLGRSERINNFGQLGFVEIRPQPISAAQNHIAQFELVNALLGTGRQNIHTQAASKQVAARVPNRLLLGDFALVYQGLHKGVVAGARHQPPAVKMVNARVAAVNPVASARRQPQVRGNGCVWLVLAANLNHANNRMRI